MAIKFSASVPPEADPRDAELARVKEERDAAQRELRDESRHVQEHVDDKHRILREYQAVVEKLKAQNATQAESLGTAMRMEREAREALKAARAGVEDVAAQAGLCLLHVGVFPRQQEWFRGEVAAVARPILAAIDAVLAPAPAQPPPDEARVWGTCAECPRSPDGRNQYPRYCVNRDRSDHKLAWAAPATPKERSDAAE